jgi:hypothetical protein
MNEPGISCSIIPIDCDVQRHISQMILEWNQRRIARILVENLEKSVRSEPTEVTPMWVKSATKNGETASLAHSSPHVTSKQEALNIRYPDKKWRFMKMSGRYHLRFA